MLTILCLIGFNLPCQIANYINVYSETPLNWTSYVPKFHFIPNMGSDPKPFISYMNNPFELNSPLN